MRSSHCNGLMGLAAGLTTTLNGRRRPTWGELSPTTVLPDRVIFVIP